MVVGASAPPPSSSSVAAPMTSSFGSLGLGLISPILSSRNSISSSSTSSLPAIHSPGGGGLRGSSSSHTSSLSTGISINHTPTALSLGSLKARKKMMQNTVHKLRASTAMVAHSSDEREVDGILYQSRIKIPHSWNFTNAKERWQAAVARTSDDQPVRRHSGATTPSPRPNVSSHGIVGGGGEFLHVAHGRGSMFMPQNAEARSRCAESLYKLSKQVGSELMIIESGAIQNIADFCDIDDGLLQSYCAATLANLTSTTVTAILDAFVANDGIPVVLEITWSPSFHVKVLCTTTLCRLSCFPEFTKSLFSSKAVIELSNMLSLPHPPLQKLCIQTLVNMICHGCEFHEKLFCGGGNVGHNKLGIVLAISQLAQEASNGRFAAQMIFNMSLYPSSASGAIRGGIGEVLYYLIQAAYSTHSLAKLQLTHPPRANDTAITQQSDQLAISRLIAMALGHFSKYLDLHLLMGTWSVKVVQHFLSLYASTGQAPALAFMLPHCARVLANLSANDEYIQTVFCGNETLLQMVVSMHTWAAADGVECQQNVLRTIANLTRCPTCGPLLVHAHILPVLHSVLLLDAGDHVASMKEDALVALVNLACHDALPNTLFELNMPQSFEASFRLHVNLPNGHSVRYMLSLTICYLTFDPRLRKMATSNLNLLIESLLYGFHYTPRSTSASIGGAPPHSPATHARHPRDPLDAFDDMSGGAGIRFRFLAAMCYTAGEIHAVDHVQSLVDIVLECLDDAASVPADTSQGYGTGAVEYFCAGILFTLSKTALTLLRKQHMVAAWTTVLFAPRVQDAVFRLSRFAIHHVCPPTPFSGGGGGAMKNLQPATQAYCTGTLYHMCAAEHTTATALLALVEACNASEDAPTLLACASTFAIVSFTPEGRQLLLTTNGLAHALNKLGRTSVCQQYAAVAACNVAITGCMWNASELKDFVVVALLRSNSFDAIQVHAKTLYNLLSHPSTRDQVIDDGVLYAFLKLAQLQTNGLDGPEETLSLCLHALFNLSDAPIYHDTILKLGVTPFLLSGVSGRRKRVLHFLNTESRRYAIGLLCNLSSRDANHKELIQNAQVTDILRSLCDGDTETRASGAMTLRNLTLSVANAEVVRVENGAVTMTWPPKVCTRNALNLLLVFMTSSHDTVRRLAAQAIGNCSLVTELQHLFLELKVGEALLRVLEDTTTVLASETARAMLITLHNLALDDACAVDMLHDRIVARWARLPPVYFADPAVCALAATSCHILSRKKHSALLIASQDIVTLCRVLGDHHGGDASILRDCLSCLAHLSTHLPTHALLFQGGVVDTLCHLLECIAGVPPPSAALYTRAAMVFRNLSLSSAVWDGGAAPLLSDAMIAVGPATIAMGFVENAVACDQLMRGVPWLARIVAALASSSSSSDLYPRVCGEVCVALANLCKIKRLRTSMVASGMLHLLLDIHGTFKSSPTHPFLQQSSTVTLHQLAAEESATLEAGLIEALLSVLDHTDVVVHEVQREEGKVSRLDECEHDDLPLATSESLCRQTYRTVRWVHYIVEAPSKLDPNFDSAPWPMRLHRIRGPLPALQDMDDRATGDGDVDSGQIMTIDTKKVTIDEDGACRDDDGAPPPLDRAKSPASLASTTPPSTASGHPPQRFTQIKKFDHHMKMTRKQSRRGYLGPSSLPHLKSELQVEK
ncbi:Aste57867_17164 [Aphanomyces stellatus]|uniref:Vacuolar protein 8 n=1 Tax=Aphanomyces stellatus TaxID=120398 RepID=A0A485L7W9_9STRA|nr:hypothetical protein As57867_017105 [Aphanomyces stellatus]VFT93921.1 Aste57867_17164 [Aphanomyces stellatus]